MNFLGGLIRGFHSLEGILAINAERKWSLQLSRLLDFIHLVEREVWVPVSSFYSNIHP